MSVSETIGSLGENASLKRTISRLNLAAAAIVGPGDDCAVVAAPDARFVVTTDTLVEGHDFRLDWSSAFDLGWKAVATNLADVAAMGAIPSALTVALVAPTTTEVTWLENFADGLRAACTALAPQAAVVGGDLASGSQLVVSVTAHGDLQGREPVLRSGAKAGDVLAIAGTLGRAAAGLQLLQAGREDWVRAYDEWVAVQLRPTPPLAAGIAAAEAGATSMLDVSDGLVRDAARVAEASEVTIEIDPTLLIGFEATLEGPAQALTTGGLVSGSAEELARRWVLGGGEDHGLLATFPAGATLPRAFKRIGVVLAADSAGHAVRLGSTGLDPAAFGWDSVTG